MRMIDDGDDKSCMALVEQPSFVEAEAEEADDEEQEASEASHVFAIPSEQRYVVVELRLLLVSHRLNMGLLK